MQVFLVKDQYSLSLQRYEDHDLKKHVRRNVPGIFTTYMETKLKLKPGSHTMAKIGDCKTNNVIEYMSRELPVRHNISPGWSEARISSSQQLICLQKYYRQMLYRKVISGSEKLSSALALLLKQNFPSSSRRDTD